MRGKSGPKHGYETTHRRRNDGKYTGKETSQTKGAHIQSTRPCAEKVEPGDQLPGGKDGEEKRKLRNGRTDRNRCKDKPAAKGAITVRGRGKKT